MTVLPDHEIEKLGLTGVIAPYSSKQVQPSSYDVLLGSSFRVMHSHSAECIDPMKDMTGLTDEVHLGVRPFILHPGEFVLGTTFERFRIPADLVARIEGKSSLGRLGLVIHSTAGYIDPGFHGTITLEMTNLTRLPIKLHPMMPIGQVSFQRMASPARRPYGSDGLNSKYVGQDGATESQMHRNY